MTAHRAEDFVRQFPENGLKLLLHGPLNVRDALRIARYPHADAIDYDRLQVDPTTYVQRDFRHLESDVVLRGPLRRRKLDLLIYILIEHQSEPDRLMSFRVLEYVVAIYRGQLREWGQQHTSLHDFVFQPVLPLVLYTGSRPWKSVGRFADLVAGGLDFSPLAPVLEPIFLPLRDTPDSQLVSAGGSFGQVLRLVQQRHARGPAFRSLLGQVVQTLEGMPEAERLRWLDLLSYIHALLYHEREDAPAMQQVIEDSVQTDPHRLEIRNMGKSYAEVLKEEGRNEGLLKSRRETLLRLLRIKFGEPSAEVIAAIQALCGRRPTRCLDGCPPQGSSALRSRYRASRLTVSAPPRVPKTPPGLHSQNALPAHRGRNMLFSGKVAPGGVFGTRGGARHYRAPPMPTLHLLVHEGDTLRLQADFTAPLELGRQRAGEPEPSPQTPCPLLPASASGPARLIVAGTSESNVSRQHALLEPLPSGLVRVHNLTRVPLTHDHGTLAPAPASNWPRPSA